MEFKCSKYEKFERENCVLVWFNRPKFVFASFDSASSSSPSLARRSSHGRRGSRDRRRAGAEGIELIVVASTFRSSLHRMLLCDSKRALVAPAPRPSRSLARFNIINEDACKRCKSQRALHEARTLWKEVRRRLVRFEWKKRKNAVPIRASLRYTRLKSYIDCYWVEYFV